VVVQLREAADPEHGGSYTLKRWHVVKLASDGGVEEVELRPDNPNFKPMRTRRADGEIRVIAEFLEVVWGETAAWLFGATGEAHATATARRG
jgi:hypothetical protein